MLKQTKTPTVPPAFNAECPGCKAPNQPGYHRVKRKQVFGGAGIATVGVLALPFFWWTGAPIAAIAGGSAMMAATKKKRYLFCQECGAVYNLHTKRPSTLKKKPEKPGHVFVGGDPLSAHDNGHSNSNDFKSPPSLKGGYSVHERTASAPSLRAMPPEQTYESSRGGGGSYTGGGGGGGYSPGYQSSPSSRYAPPPHQEDHYNEPPQYGGGGGGYSSSPSYQQRSGPPSGHYEQHNNSGHYDDGYDNKPSPNYGRSLPQPGYQASPSSGRFQPPQPRQQGDQYQAPSSGRFQAPAPSYASPNSGRYQPPQAQQGYQASPSSGRYQPPSYAIVAPVGRPV